MKYQKKPVIIEAFQFGVDKESQWWTDAIESNIVYTTSVGDVINPGFLTNHTHTYIKTLEGDMEVREGDYVIQGVRGELYPCKPDIFEETYERVE